MKYSTVKIGKIADVKGGKRLPKGEQLTQEKTAHPYIRAQDIRNRRVIFDDPQYVTDELFQKIKRYTVKTNDVCITIVGANIGQVGIVPSFLNGANLTENAVKLVNLKDCDPFFLFYSLMLDSSQEQMKYFAAGAAQPKLGIYKVKEVKVPLPPLPAQRKIAAVLSAYDDLIENNTRRIALLEEMAQRIYREWFVHYRFPGHESVPLVEVDGFGPVPEGWEVVKLGNVLELAYGKGLTKKARVEGPFPVYGSSGIVDYHKEALIEGPGIIVGRKGNVGSVFWSNTDFYPIDTTYYVQTELPLHYVYYNLQYQNFMNTHAAVPGLSRKNAYLNKFVVPPSDLMTKFQNFIEPVFSEVRNLTNKNTTLRQARDLLLPRLISGAVDVSVLEIDLGEN